MKMLALSLALVFVPAAPAQTVWYVDANGCSGSGDGSAAAPFCAIQEGIVAASDGDTVVVLPGLYLENLNYLGKAIRVRSDADGDPLTHDPVPAATVVDGQAAASVVVFDQGEGAGAVLEGFTLTNGGGSRYGGGVRCQGASPTITGNVIVGNVANEVNGPIDEGGFGGGVYCEYGAPTITGNTISDNEAVAQGKSRGQGGGIYCRDASPSISGNVLERNHATWVGSGIYVYGGVRDDLRERPRRQRRVATRAAASCSSTRRTRSSTTSFARIVRDTAAASRATARAA